MGLGQQAYMSAGDQLRWSVRDFLTRLTVGLEPGPRWASIEDIRRAVDPMVTLELMRELTAERDWGIEEGRGPDAERFRRRDPGPVPIV